ncbi:DEAD/DEAH box helicase [Desulfovibrio litoralis]|uniref:DEAD/DEAH box helicase n=1 Tax=Desulfovibrio litoralis DSM 11393 TaxID=1121455 RepID=A0A1M7THA2_9BACT|nr:DEAD/DEAH box helicase [Desulfovibrio litoralis]SHN70033.1 DEAD/DEAH box helicase [Desulfovibrio litoralis DSM 11393]
MIADLIEGTNARDDIEQIITSIHKNGPIAPDLLERLAYYKKFHPVILSEYENQIVSVMGLFYKTSNSSSSVLEEVYSIFSSAIASEFGANFTPVQASAYKQISSKLYFSFSAPTSAGKSFLFRNIIRDLKGDMVIVVPSRALIAEYYQEVISVVDKSTMVLQFIDNVNTSKLRNRIFIITPERGMELFRRIHDFNIEIFLFDEAQISEEYIRGMKFDAFVRRVDRYLPTAKKVFAHPFVVNPEAQLEKHGFKVMAAAQNYRQQSVGKLFMVHEAGIFSFFSPHTNTKTISYHRDIVEEELGNGGTLLAYVSKASIYNKEIFERFGKYIEMCPKVVDTQALAIISKLKDFIGASDSNSDKYSMMINLMEKGIVIHHGSMPLRARILVEEFIRSGFAKICFSTSTLVQGINMPFSVVWINNFYNLMGLTLKNLIGRSGRTSSKTHFFDFGYTIVEQENLKTFIERYNVDFSLKSKSMLDEDFSRIEEDLKDIAEAIAENSFNDELNLPESQVERIKNCDIFNSVSFILDVIFRDGEVIGGNEYYALNETIRKKVKNEFINIFSSHLRKKQLLPTEKAVLSAAVPIILWQVQSTSFSQIVSLRHAWISKKKERNEIRKQFELGKIVHEEMKKQLEALNTRYSPRASTIPNKDLTRAGIFPETASVLDVSYDLIVYDTYDYLDKVIAISMADPLCAAFSLYNEKYQDKRAEKFINYVRYGTDDPIEIWLLRYGFSFEDLKWLHEVVDNVDSTQIYFNQGVNSIAQEKYALIERFL